MIWGGAEIGTWKKAAFDDFYSTMTYGRFPCIFGASGVKNDEIRYYYDNDNITIDNINQKDDLPNLRKSLEYFVKNSRDYGKNTSFVAFFDIKSSQTDLNEYEKLFWKILQKLHNYDKSEWPDNIPIDPSNHLWEWCFSGEPIFVVCNTPSHVLRKSWHSEYFMITFQPRWVFDFLSKPIGKDGVQQVRKLLKSYDDISEYPFFGAYGNPNNKEWKQYFIDDTNDDKFACPFTYSKNQQGIKLETGNKITLEDAVYELLPKTGSVEVQRDTPNREHPWHLHPSNETLLIVNGKITFSYKKETITCTSGDRILLPKNTEHASIASSAGCLYIIARDYVWKENE